MVPEIGTEPRYRARVEIWVCDFHRPAGLFRCMTNKLRIATMCLLMLVAILLAPSQPAGAEPCRAIYVYPPDRPPVLIRICPYP